MALSDLWTSQDDSGSSGGAWGSLANGLAGLYGGYQGMNSASGLNNQISGALNQNMGTTNSAISTLQQQIAQQRQQAQAAYDAARGQIDTQNSGLQNDIGTMTSNLTALSDPNSPYMQMARQAVERKDAAAGRRSQWGERETQLAGTLADYVGKYSPGLQNSITSARNQINQNNLGLANMFSTMNNPADRNQLALAQMLQQQQSGASALNTTGREAANRAITNQNSLITNGIKGAGSLAQLLFGGGQGGAGYSNILGSLFSSPGGSGFGDGSLYGDSFQPLGNYGTSVDGALGGYGYGNLPSGDYFGGGGLGGVPTSGWDGGYTGGGSDFSELW